MRVLALDVGSRRIGVAVSDPTGLIARSLEVVPAAIPRKAIERIGNLIKDLGVEHVVVGLPLNMDGTEGDQAGRVRHFAQRLAESVVVPIDFWDERLSTFEAERLMIDSGVNRADRQKRIDAVAAAVILQAYLDSLPR